MGRRKDRRVDRSGPQWFSMKRSQFEWLRKKAEEQSNLLGVNVTPSMVVRALIEQQRHLELEKKRVWDDEEALGAV